MQIIFLANKAKNNYEKDDCHMENNIKQNTDFSNNVKQFELNEAKKKMGIQAEWEKSATPQQPVQSDDPKEQHFNTLF